MIDIITTIDRDIIHLSAVASTLPTALQVVLAVVAGFALGQVHFRGLGRATTLFAQGRTLPALAWQIGRFLLLIPILVLAAKLGAAILLALAAGLLIARHLVVAAARRRGRERAA
ncbi:ATP synthase subunit I [Tistrella sp. BH-R2-4]|uniref:ATP synthase subunit I n=1 Tax=Tistrella arctica TaxID=3133430 RepID=A0ABU9YF08_9PROT